MALIQIGQDHKAPQRIVETVAAVNDQRKRTIAHKVSAIFDGNLRGRTIAVLGLSFKPNTDDMRDAPSISLIAALQDMGAKVRAYDPAGMENAKRLLSDVTFCDDPYDSAQDSDALVIVTEWHQFRALDFARLKAIMIQPILIDLRNIYRPEEMTKHNFQYYCVGKSPQPSPTRISSKHPRV
jgi:UDPglucose 6-dehydrogenase